MVVSRSQPMSIKAFINGFDNFKTDYTTATMLLPLLLASIAASTAVVPDLYLTNVTVGAAYNESDIATIDEKLVYTGDIESTASWSSMTTDNSFPGNSRAADLQGSLSTLTSIADSENPTDTWEATSTKNLENISKAAAVVSTPAKTTFVTNSIVDAETSANNTSSAVAHTTSTESPKYEIMSTTLVGSASLAEVSSSVTTGYGERGSSEAVTDDINLTHEYTLVLPTVTEELSSEYTTSEMDSTLETKSYVATEKAPTDTTAYEESTSYDATTAFIETTHEQYEESTSHEATTTFIETTHEQYEESTSNEATTTFIETTHEQYEESTSYEATTTFIETTHEQSSLQPTEFTLSETSAASQFDEVNTTWTLTTTDSGGITANTAHTSSEVYNTLTSARRPGENSTPTYSSRNYLIDINATSSSLAAIGDTASATPSVTSAGPSQSATTGANAAASISSPVTAAHFTGQSVEGTHAYQETAGSSLTTAANRAATTVENIYVSNEKTTGLVSATAAATVTAAPTLGNASSTQKTLSGSSAPTGATAATATSAAPVAAASTLGDASSTQKTLSGSSAPTGATTATEAPSVFCKTWTPEPCFGNTTRLPSSSIGQRIYFASECYAECMNTTDAGPQWVIYKTSTTESGVLLNTTQLQHQSTTIQTINITMTTTSATNNITTLKSTTNPTVVPSFASQSSFSATPTTASVYVEKGKVVEVLRNLSQVTVTAGNAKELAATVQAATSYADSLTTSAVTSASSIINKMAGLISNGALTPDLYPVPGAIGEIVGNLLNANATVLAQAQSQNNVSIQENLESSLYALAEAATQSGSSIDDSYLRLQVDNLAFQVVRDSSVCGLTISGANSLSQASIMPVFINDTSTSTSFADATVVRLSHLVANSTKTFLVYNNAKLFQASSSLKADTNTRVLSAQLPKTSNRNLPGLISMVFTGLSAPPNGTIRQCGYWDYGTGSWSSAGCSAKTSSENQVECVCEHLTNFAALLAINDIAPNPALDILSTVGLALSVASLTAVVVTSVFLRKMRRTVSQKVLLNLALSLLLLDVLFLVGVNSTNSKGGCIAVAALLHYFLLTSFMWMLMESILQYLRFVKVLGTYIPRFILKTAIPAWGAPAVVVAIICGVNLNLYYRGNNSYCLAQEEVVYYGVLLPIGLIITVNWIIFAIVLKHFCCRSRRFAYQGKGSENSLAQLHAQAGIAICTLLGLTWVFGFLTAIPDATASLAFQWLFCICNTLQGFLIFVFHCVREPAVRKEWKRLCCRKKLSTERSTISSSEDSTAMTRSTSGTRSQVYSVSSDPARSIHFSSLMPSHKGSYDLSSVGGMR